MWGGTVLLIVRMSSSVREYWIVQRLKSPLILNEDVVTRRGLVFKLAISCTNTECNREALISDPYVKSLNAKSVLWIREIGREGNSLGLSVASSTFFRTLLDLPKEILG